ncbi:MAG: TolC family protein [Epsilonproteobacteria bacterium]|nr:TolC family protein [Campylobacterota bacterium]
MKKSILLFTAAVGLCAQTLTLENCLQKALETHPDIKSRLLEREIQHTRLKSQKSARLPQISAYGEYDPQRTYVMPQNGTFHTLDKEGWSVGVSLRQQIFDFSKTTHRIEAAKTAEEIARLDYEEARALMRYNVRNAYALVAVQAQALEARKKDLEAKRSMLEQARALVANGLKTRADESRFVAALRQAEDALALAQSAYEKARIALASLIGETIPSDAWIDASVLSNKEVAPKLDDSAVTANNLRLRIAKERVRSAEAGYKSARAEHFGSFDLIADASHFDNLNDYDTTLVGVRYAVPLYSGGRISAQAAEARLSRLKAAQNYEASRRAVMKDYLSVLADLKESDKRIAAREAQLTASVQTAELVEGRYKEGLATYMEVLDAQALKLDAELGLLSARYNKYERINRLEYLNGK